MRLPVLRGRPQAVLLAAVTTVVFVLTSSPAAANVLPPAEKTLPVKVPSLGGLSVGTATMTVTYTHQTATATAVAPSVFVGKGQEFRLVTCVKAHSRRKTYTTTCETKNVDTRGIQNPIAVAAPTVTAELERPESKRTAYLSYLLSVRYKTTDGSFREAASSWPRGGLENASIGVPPVRSATSPEAVGVGVPLNLGRTGGINSGLVNSMCKPTRLEAPPPPGPGVSTDGLGAGAPAYYEIGEPTGAHAGEPPAGVMLLIHGGGWNLTGAGAAAYKRDDAARWRARGWRTLNISYRPCRQTFGDVRWFYDRARDLWGTDIPYCASGGSAGGNLALMLAYGRPSLACAISQAGPADVLALRNQSTPIGGTQGPRWVYNLLAAAVGPARAIWWSPGRLPIGGSIRARVLFALAKRDPYIPIAQATALRDTMRAADPDAYVDVFRLDRGDERWVHGKVSEAALAEYHEREEKLVAPLVDGAG